MAQMTADYSRRDCHRQVLDNSISSISTAVLYAQLLPLTRHKMCRSSCDDVIGSRAVRGDFQQFYDCDIASETHITISDNSCLLSNIVM